MRFLPAALLLLASLQAGAVQMYKCVDAKGVTHYTEQPLPGCKGRALDVKPLPPPSGAERAPAADIGEQEREFRRRQVERGEAARKSAVEASRRERRCAQARAELDRLSRSRLYVRNARGEREFLDEAASAARISRQQEEVNGACR